MTVTTVIQLEPVGVVSGVVLKLNPDNLRASSYWDYISGAEYFKLWYIGYIDGGGGNTVHDTTKSHAHDAVLPHYGRWEFVVQACNENGCFALGHHPFKEVSPPSPTKD
ncbi:MAG: hypothetical protein F4X34_05780 [Chloroflexi bacterium]|nr:hypothetical protein [Chloroflexota bacterium]